MRRAITNWILGLLALALLAGACGTSASPDGAERVVEPDPATDTDAGDTATEDEPTDDAAGDEADPIELTASYKGVTAETISIGVTAIDWDTLAEFGVLFGRSNSGDLWQAALEAINDRGGIHGRTIEVLVEEFLPVGSESFDESCNRLTQDEEVFLIVGQALEDHVLCAVEVNETAAVTVAGMADPILDRARAPYATLWASFETQAENLVALVEDAGVLDGATIGISGSADVGVVEYQTIVDAFRAAGYDVVEGLSAANDGDIPETSRAMALAFERFRDAGVDFTVSTTGVPLEIFTAQDAGYDPGQWLLTIVLDDSSLSEAGVDADYVDGALAIVNSPVSTDRQPSMGDDPAVAACIDGLEERAGRELPYELGLEISDLAIALYACAIADIVETAMLAAGPNLTYDTFQAGLESIGDIDLAGYFESSLDAGDLGAAKGLRLARFDADTGAWELLD